MSNWDVYAEHFADGMPAGDIVSSVFIIALCALGVIVARWMYKQL
ncbi:MAG: hypothetical protein ACOX8X_05775 [Methanomethylophilus sp.]|jgi:hypothetical protein